MIKIAWCPEFCLPLPDNHRFPMEKYKLLPQQHIYEGTASKEQFFSPNKASRSDILLAHTSGYLDKLEKLSLSAAEIRKIGFPLSKALVKREKLIVQGTIDATKYAFENGVAFNSAGGTHHAFSDRGEGFCLLNDMAVAAAYLIARKKIKRVLIVDLDVHQGNGTAAIFKDYSSVFTFSIHGRKNYPLHKEHSNCDVELDDGTEDDAYLEQLDRYIKMIWRKVNPEFVFYQAGVDVLRNDKLGRLGLSIEGCKNRDSIVLECCKKQQIPIAVTMGGGYATKITTIVEAHANTFRVAKHLFD